ncbi:extracellular solute-binding protein [Streptomyces sp. NPDC051940]|uniref:ABC transporter substrate-binding protein n=1 Tax=Streptomyces sp. NPDC051940 TaxID=3155675 RepID=UPI00342FE51C
MRTRVSAGSLLAAAVLAAAVGCTGGGAGTSEQSVEGGSDPKAVSGDITVLTHRTDLVQNGTMKKYADEFHKRYPKVNVTFDGITDYEGEVKIRMNTTNYGDVLMIPGVIARNDYPKFFASLGTPAELAQKYRFTGYSTVDDKVYGLSNFGSAMGFVYNKAVWGKAGITDWPTTPDEFLAGLKAIKAKTDSVPYYTNFKDMWPLTQWQGYLGGMSCDPLGNDKLATADDPWAEGSDLRTIDTLLYDVVKQGLVEKDPTTTNWENSKGLIAKGEIATMALGSWAISQMQDAATKAGANPDDIGFMPFPQQKDGKWCTALNGDYQQAVSIHSKHKEAARAWIEWFTGESGYPANEKAVSTLKSDPLPEALQPFTEAGVELVEISQAKAVQVNAIDNASEVGFTKPDYRQRIVEMAKGSRDGSLEGELDALAKKWADAVGSAG